MKLFFIGLVIAMSMNVHAAEKKMNNTFVKAEKAATRKVATTGADPQKAAGEIIRHLFGRGYEPMNIQSFSNQNSFEVTIGAGTANDGAAIYLVEYSNLNLAGAKENETVANIKITYRGGN